MAETELAWAAGFFDGEGSSGASQTGSFGTRRRLKSYPRISLSQNELENLERFKAAVGGVGNINGPYGGRVTYQYQVSGRKASLVMHQLWPYLGCVKKRQFVRAVRTARERNLP